MNTEQLISEKQALEAELQAQEAKEDRLKSIEMLIADINKLDEAKQLLLAEDLTSFHDTIIRTPYRARLTTNTGRQTTFETQRPDEYRRPEDAQITINIPKGLSMMNEYRWVMIAVMEDRISKRMQKLSAK